jgi:hypothetical protein
VNTIRVTVEFSTDGRPGMRWERTSTESANAYDLLGRAFEVARREEGTPFGPALAEFFKGALVRKKDLEDLLAELE